MEGGGAIAAVPWHVDVMRGSARWRWSPPPPYLYPRGSQNTHTPGFIPKVGQVFNTNKTRRSSNLPVITNYSLRCTLSPPLTDDRDDGTAIVALGAGIGPLADLQMPQQHESSGRQHIHWLCSSQRCLMAHAHGGGAAMPVAGLQPCVC